MTKIISTKTGAQTIASTKTPLLLFFIVTTILLSTTFILAASFGYDFATSVSGTGTGTSVTNVYICNETMNCTGPQGPQGIQGIQGVAGVDGINGTINYSLVYFKNETFNKTEILNFNYYNATNPPPAGGVNLSAYYNTTTLQNLSQLFDDLGNRGYTYLSNFTNDLGIGNWTLDKGSYLTSSQILGFGYYNASSFPAPLNNKSRENTGFFPEDIGTFTYNETTHVFSLTNAVVYINGTSRTIVSDSVTLPSTDGIKYYISYKNLSSLDVSTPPWTFDGVAQVATIYIDGNNKSVIGDERHGAIMDWATHEYLHETQGTKYVSGFAGTFDSLTFNLTLGEIEDEDLSFYPKTTQTRANVMYRNGTVWTWVANTTLPFYQNATNVYYDNSGNLTVIPNNDFFAVFYYASNTRVPIFTIVPQRSDANIANSRANNDPSSISFGTTFPNDEYKLLYRVIYKASGGVAVYQEAADYRTYYGNGATGVGTGSATANLVPYTGANQNVDLGFYNFSTTGNIIFNNITRFYSTTANGYSRINVYDGDLTDKVLSRDIVSVVQAGENITKGQSVYMISNNGNYPVVMRAIANNSTTAKVLGIALNNITNQSYGEVMKIGVITGIDTTGYTSGQSLYLSPTTYGGFTGTRPSGLNQYVDYVGLVIVPNSTSGSIGVQIRQLENMETGTTATTWTGTNVNATGNLTALNINVTNNLYAKMPYGVFTANSTQNASVGATAQLAYFNTTTMSSGVTLVSNTNITVSVAGLYDVTSVYQTFELTNNNAWMYLWYKKNGVNIAESAKYLDIKTGNVVMQGTNQAFVYLNTTDTLQVYWAGKSTNTSLYYVNSNSYAPSSPSIKTTLKKIGEQ